MAKKGAIKFDGAYLYWNVNKDILSHVYIYHCMFMESEDLYRIKKNQKPATHYLLANVTFLSFYVFKFLW